MKLMDMLHGRVCVTPVQNEAGIKTDEIKLRVVTKRRDIHIQVKRSYRYNGNRVYIR